MLAREFRTAKELGIPSDVHDALVAFTREDAVPDFAMALPNNCVIGQCERKLSREIPNKSHGIVGKIFLAFARGGLSGFSHGDITLRQAQEAVRNALSFGDPMWRDVMGAPHA